MYTPPSFRVEDLGVIHAFIRANSFAAIVSAHEGIPSGTHLPFMVDSARGNYGTLRAHLARANPLWKTWSSETDVLVIFTGPHAYISPAWYQHQKTVPTWNYSAVHVHGKPRLIKSTEELRALVAQQVAWYEDAEQSSWDRTLMEGVMETELKAIVGFEIEIDRIEAKFKFNQNRAPEDQAGVVRALEGSACPFKKAAGTFMRSLKGRRPS